MRLIRLVLCLEKHNCFFFILCNDTGWINAKTWSTALSKCHPSLYCASKHKGMMAVASAYDTNTQSDSSNFPALKPRHSALSRLHNIVSSLTPTQQWDYSRFIPSPFTASTFPKPPALNLPNRLWQSLFLCRDQSMHRRLALRAATVAFKLLHRCTPTG